jgi:hypothetical protein
MRTAGRSLVRILAAAVAVLGLGLLSATPAQAATRSELLALVDREVADVSFFWTMYAHRREAPYSSFDWSTDLCSWSPDRPLGFDFTRACRRHDFGYRNYKMLGAFNETVRLRVDNAFYSDMKAVCSRYSLLVRSACLGTASLYYQAVRDFGAS